MTKKERAALLAAGEKRLALICEVMDDALQNNDFAFAKVYEHKHDGAAYMMEALGLFSYEEYRARSKAVFDHYLKAAFPEVIPEEAGHP